MSDGAAEGRPLTRAARWRRWCLVAGLVLIVMALVPPLSGAARQDQYAAALQFSLLAIAVPALLALGAPWDLLGLAGGDAPGTRPRFCDRLADRRRRHPELPRTLLFIACDLCVVVAWRTPGAVAAVAHHAWLAPLEAVTLVVFGVGLWLELVSSPPMEPRSGPFQRAVLSAIVMWAFWIDAYVVGLSNHDLYTNFHHVAGQGLSAAADQQIAAVMLWFVATLAFVPVVFWNAYTWLKAEEDPDAELAALTRFERRRGPPSVPPAPGRPGEGAAPAP